MWCSSSCPRSERPARRARPPQSSKASRRRAKFMRRSPATWSKSIGELEENPAISQRGCGRKRLVLSRAKIADPNELTGLLDEAAYQGTDRYSEHEARAAPHRRCVVGAFPYCLFFNYAFLMRRLLTWAPACSLSGLRGRRGKRDLDAVAVRKNDSLNRLKKRRKTLQCWQAGSSFSRLSPVFCCC